MVAIPVIPVFQLHQCTSACPMFSLSQRLGSQVANLQAQLQQRDRAIEAARIELSSSLGRAIVRRIRCNWHSPTASRLVYLDFNYVSLQQFNALFDFLPIRRGADPENPLVYTCSVLPTDPELLRRMGKRATAMRSITSLDVANTVPHGKEHWYEKLVSFNEKKTVVLNDPFDVAYRESTETLTIRFSWASVNPRFGDRELWN